MATEILTVTGKPMPLDLLLFKRFRREIPGFVEATLDGNPGLADFGPVLPLGTAVTVAVPTSGAAVRRRPFVSLTA